MIYQANTIISTLSSQVPEVSGDAKVYLRIGETDMVGNVNIGRLPTIYVRQVQTDYTFDAEPQHFGTRSAEWVVTICVASSLNRSAEQFRALERMKISAMSALSQNTTLGITNIREDPPVIGQTIIKVDIRFTTETSYTNTYDEE